MIQQTCPIFKIIEMIENKVLQDCTKVKILRGDNGMEFVYPIIGG